MRSVVQRVSEASVQVAGERVGAIGQGLVVLLGVGEGDSPEDAAYLADKIAHLRIFEDAEGKMNRSVRDVAGGVLAISQFTLYGDVRKGRRPSFTAAAHPEEGKRLYEEFVHRLTRLVARVETGRFGAHMRVSLVNEGPVTLLLDSAREF